ncbi:MAG: hypothetical protein ACLR6J_07760 [Parabacteroides merdae]
MDLLLAGLMSLIPECAYGCRFAAFGNADKPDHRGSGAVSCALDQLKGRPMYSNPSNQFVALVRRYGKTPVPIDPGFRLEENLLLSSQDGVPTDLPIKKMEYPVIRREVGVNWLRTKRGLASGAFR